ncbi:TolC family protein [Aquincola sp. S2]|uniref:TolC family protein n=1 Tax=Pseudaquabacterium terrae TaxID=2732868 RepID=A0ABX2ENN2_9BURK|nr:TolC family protein [Aquabacterium terrae]NRF70250.1 TolC family protein [Aquabacterium terrae]
MPRFTHLLAPLRGAVVAWIMVLAAGTAGANCPDDAPLPTRSAPPEQARTELRTLVRHAIDHSPQAGVTRLLAEAALDDTAEARAARAPQASLNASVGPSLSRSAGHTDSSAAHGGVSLNVSQLLWDGGRTDRLVDWRDRLADAARFGDLSNREALALSTVSLALERSRFRQQVLVYGQYVRKMQCLAGALEQIVAADRGRLSELVQVRKSLQQAELSRTQTESQLRQVEVRLRRLVGDTLPGADDWSTLLSAVPDVTGLQVEALRSAEIAQLDASAAAAQQFARSVEASHQPRVSWTGGANAASGFGGTIGTNHSKGLSFGLAISIPLIDQGIAAASAAAKKRAQAAVLQREEALQARRTRIAEVHEQTTSSFDRAQRVGAVLRDSERLRDFTLQQWQQLGRRSLFDVMAAESDHYGLRISLVNALHDGQQMNAILLSLGRGVQEWLQ